MGVPFDPSDPYNPASPFDMGEEEDEHTQSDTHDEQDADEESNTDDEPQPDFQLDNLVAMLEDNDPEYGEKGWNRNAEVFSFAMQHANIALIKRRDDYCDRIMELIEAWVDELNRYFTHNGRNQEFFDSEPKIPNDKEYFHLREAIRTYRTLGGTGFKGWKEYTQRKSVEQRRARREALEESRRSGRPPNFPNRTSPHHSSLYRAVLRAFWIKRPLKPPR